MCDPVSIIAGGTALVGGVVSANAANRQADAVEDAGRQQAAATTTAINTYNQTSPAAALSQNYGSSLTSQIANMLGLTPNQPATPALPNFNGFTLEDYGGPASVAIRGGMPVRADGDPRAGQPGRDIIIGSDQTVQPSAGVRASGVIMGGSPGARSYGDTISTSSAGQQVRDLPGYQFQLDEGMRGVREHLSSAGGLYSGKALKEITKYGQNFAETKYQTHLNNMMQALGAMDSASVNTLNAATGNAANVASTQIAAAGHSNDATTNLVSGITGAAGAIANGMASSDVNRIGDGSGGFTFQQNGGNNLGRVA